MSIFSRLFLQNLCNPESGVFPISFMPQHQLQIEKQTSLWQCQNHTDHDWIDGITIHVFFVLFLIGWCSDDTWCWSASLSLIRHIYLSLKYFVYTLRGLLSLFNSPLHNYMLRGEKQRKCSIKNYVHALKTHPKPIKEEC